MICPTGSTCAAICSTPSAMEFKRLSLSFSRSISAGCISAFCAAATSWALAASSASREARSAAAIVFSAAPLASPRRVASCVAARLADLPTFRTYSC